MKHYTSYTNYLHGLPDVHARDLGDINYRAEIERGKYLGMYNNHAKPGIYVLDYRKQLYLDVSDRMATIADRSVTELMKGGLPFALSLWHRDDFEIYNNHILPDSLDFLSSKPISEYGHYIFKCNYRVKHRSGTYIKIEQTSFFNRFAEDGTPLMAIGFLQEITNRAFDDNILHTIEHVGGYRNKLVFEKLHVPGKTVLSDRELEILQWIIAGYKNGQIAEELKIKIDTVEKHRKNMLAKTRFLTMEQLVAYAFRNKLVR